MPRWQVAGKATISKYKIQLTKTKQYDLEDRTFIFARDCRILVRKLPKVVTNFEDGPQLTRASGSVGGNYIEANESLSKRDFKHRIKICRKEEKESKYWLKLVYIKNNKSLEKERKRLIKEATELTKIFGSILEKSK
jgi:four helix bundle protein